MNRKQFGILIVLLIVLGGAGWYVHTSHQEAAASGEQGSGRKLVGDAFPLNDVTHINIKQGTNEVNLEKKDDLWQVRERGGYPANFSSISEFLIKVKDLKVVQTEPIGASQLSRMQLAPGAGANSAIEVALLGKDEKAIKTLTLGKKHFHKGSPQEQQQFPAGAEGTPDGRYLFVGSDTKNVLLIGDPLNNMEARPEQWLDKDFFKVERPKDVAVTFPEPTNSWRIERDAESGDWKLSDAKGDEKLDAARASGVSSPFASPTIEDVVLPNVSPEANGLDKPIVVTVGTFDDFIYSIKIGAKKGENYAIAMTVKADEPRVRSVSKDEKPEDKAKADKAWAQREKDLDEKLKQLKRFEKWTFLVPAWTVDPVLKERKDLLEEKKIEEKKDDAKAGEPASMTLPMTFPGADDKSSAAPK